MRPPPTPPLPIPVARRPAAVLPLPAVLLALLLLLLAAAAAAIDFPPLTGRVVDEARLLTAAERDSLTEALAQHERATGQQVVVVTLQSLRERPIEDYGYQLGRHWGIGAKGKNSGALFIVAPKERKVRIEVGYGLEGTLTDAASRLIIENVVLPSFRSGQFGPGIVAGTGAILKTLAGDPAATPAAEAARPAAQRWDSDVPIPFLMMVLGFLAVWAIVRYRRPVPGVGGRRRRAIDRDAGFGFGIGLGGGFGGGWGDGGGDDGFSGGGGDFGGGGASGGW